MNETVTMLRHLAAQIEGDEENDVVAALVISMRSDGAWAATCNKEVDPMAGVALLEFAKLDLMAGGHRWTKFEPAANDNVN